MTSSPKRFSQNDQFDAKKEIFIDAQEATVVDAILTAQLDEVGARRHFSEVLMNKFVVSALQRLSNSNGNNDGPSDSSLTQFAKDLRLLSSRARLLGGINYHILRLLEWENPAFTLSSLIIYTHICLHPNLALVLPPAGIILGIMVPGYSYKHPFPRQYLPEAPYEKQSIVLNAEVNMESKSVSEAISEIGGKVRDAAKVLDDLEQFYYGPGSFANESYSSAIYMLLLISAIGSAYAAKFVPVTPAMIVTGWLLVCLNHPSIKHQVKTFEKEYMKKHEKDLENMVKAFEQREIDYKPSNIPEEVHDVEIFELEKQGLTPRIYEPWLFTRDIYDIRSEKRVQQERPIGTFSLDEVCPPLGWRFDSDHPWILDPYTKYWIVEHGIRDVESEDDGSWVYDYVNGTRDCWRRRRWIRACFRDAGPARSAQE